MKHIATPDDPKPLSERTDDEIRDRARKLFEDTDRIDIPPNGQVVRMGDGVVALVEAVIYIGKDD